MARADLRIYLGAAPGVGKTYAMLDEARRRAERGTDVVVGLVETHGRPGTAAKLEGLEVLPRRQIEHRGVVLEELDVDAVIARRPAVVLVDELAHTNAPGSRHEKRWQDIDEILAAGIDVISTVNIQHLESVNDVVHEITGVRQQETVPDRFVRSADQVELVDMTPEALRRRLAHGNVYPPQRIDAALSNYFRPGNLAALRELALLWVADRVDESLKGYLEAHRIEGSWETRERIVVAMTGAPGTDELIRRAARMAGRLRADLVGVHVSAGTGLRSPSATMAEYRTLVHDLGGRYHELVGDDPGRSIAEFARSERATQVVLGATRERTWRWRRTVADTVLRGTNGIDVHVMATGAEPPSASDNGPERVRPRAFRLSRRRRVAGFAIGALGLPAMTVGLVSVRSHTDLAVVLLAYLAVVLGATTVGGAVPGLMTAAVAFLLENYYFIEPVHSWDIAQGRNVVSLLGFLGFASVASIAVHRLDERAQDVRRARSEAEALARTAATIVADTDSVALLLDNLRTTFGVEAVGLLRRDDHDWAPVAVSGTEPPTSPDDGAAFDVDADTVLVLRTGALPTDDRRVVAAFAAQLATVLEQRRLRELSTRLAFAAEADEFRTGLLRSVSHDLRTPLAGIKAAATTLLADDVVWDQAHQREFLHAIDADCDRLTRLVSDLLDASRLQAGVLPAAAVPVGLDDVIAGAVASLPDLVSELVIELPDDPPLVDTDPALLERSIANLISNANRYHRPGTPIRVIGSVVGDEVRLLVMDQGPGIPIEGRARALAPFQRLGDDPSATGVGLGLSIVDGFIRLLGGSLTLEDTPGGGLTAIIALPRGDTNVEEEP